MREDPGPPTRTLPQPLPLHEHSPCTLPPQKALQLQGALEAPGALGSHLGQWDQGDHVHPDEEVEGGMSGTRAGMGSWYVEGLVCGIRWAEHLPGTPSLLQGQQGLGFHFGQEAQCLLLGPEDHAPQGSPENRGEGSGKRAIVVIPISTVFKLPGMEFM